MTERLQFAHHILKNRCQSEHNYYLTRFWRAWYTVKALLCIALNRPDCRTSDHITVAAWNGHYYYSHDCYNAYAWTQLVVGYGTLSNWTYSVYDESNC